MPTEQEVNELADAMWQLLDDMGPSGQNVCLAAKAQARIAYEPFMTAIERESGAYRGLITLEDALEIERSTG